MAVLLKKKKRAWDRELLSAKQLGLKGLRQEQLQARARLGPAVYKDSCSRKSLDKSSCRQGQGWELLSATTAGAERVKKRAAAGKGKVRTCYLPGQLVLKGLRQEQLQAKVRLGTAVYKNSWD